ncbi:MAG: hypothetical protein IT473_01040 [Lysobacter sp.]|nr:hypothetical protein [Lysobacter sp.]
MTESEKKLEQMLKDFEKANPDAGKALRKLVDETPALKGNLLSSIEKGTLERIEPTPAGIPPNIPGFYTSKEETLPSGEKLKANSIYISTTELIDAGKDPKIANNMRMIMTHESEHALNKDSILKADKAFEDKLLAIAKGPSPHDYTSVLAEKGKSDRLREATDQIGGFNAVAAYVFKENPGATQAQLYQKLYDSCPEMEPYFNVKGTPPKATYELKDGLTLGKDGQLALTPPDVKEKNIEAMGKYFYDARPYQEQYGTRDLVRALKTELDTQTAEAAKNPSYTPPEVRVNLKELGLQHLSPHLPSGITDTSSSPYIRGSAQEPQPALREGHERTHLHALDGHGVGTRDSGGFKVDPSLSELLKAMNDPNSNPVSMREALANFAKQPDIQHIRQEGAREYVQQEAQKVQETAKPQPAQEAPAQETPARKVSGM